MTILPTCASSSISARWSVAPQSLRTCPAAAELYADNIWPDSPASYRSVFTTYYEALEALGRSLMRIFALSLGMPGTFF